VAAVGISSRLNYKRAEAPEETRQVFLGQLVFPDAEDGLAAGAEGAGDEAVAGAVGGELFTPEDGVGFGLRGVERATVPKAAVNEDGEFAHGENEVGFAEEQPVSSPAGDAIGAEDRDEAELGGLGKATNRNRLIASGCRSVSWAVMANAVLTAKLDSSYDDAVEERYHFPKQYFGRVSAAVGDWIIYYESRRDGGRQVYFAMARVVGVSPDPNQKGYFYAQISDYSIFAEPVPFKADNELLESGVRNPDGSTNPGSFINAVRLLTRDDFQKICRLGMMAVLPDDEPNIESIVGDLAVAENQADYGEPRQIATVSRPMRDAAFARVVRRAYDRTCAMTGLQLINGGGRCEIEAAHIKPVENDGPDSPRNGIALSRTVHWLFDRGFLSITDDGQILQVPKLVPEPIKRLLNPDSRIVFPKDPGHAPHSVFLRYHREVKFKG
jgi:putative restriction endonuclease